MKISFFSFAVNTLFPIDIAHRQFHKYVKEDFEYILFNDAYQANMEKDINTITSANKIKCVRVPQHIHKSQNPSEAYADTVNWAVHEYAVQNKCEIIVLMHSDIFPICETTILNVIGNHTVASTAEFRLLNGKGITYCYPAFTIINMNNLINPKELDFSLETGLDVGGKTKNFINKYPNNVKFVPNYQASYFLATLGENDPFAEYFKQDLEICKNHGISQGWICEGFYHYMAGSQWNAGNPTFAAGLKLRMDLFLKYFY